MRIELPFPLTLGDIRLAVGAESEKNDGTPVTVITTDTRKLRKNDLYVALHGARDDGHRYLEAARAAGALALVSEIEATGGIKVKNTHSALLDIAALSLEQRRVPVIAITGSVGKTGTKDAVAAALSPRYKVHKTRENENNELGIAKTVLSRNANTTLLVLEMGTNHPGEISPLSRCVSPDLAIITAIGSAHIGAFGTKEAILAEKASITDGMRDGKLLVLGDDPLLSSLCLPIKKRTIGMYTKADFCAEGVYSSRFGTSYTLKAEGVRQRVFLRGAGRPRILASLFALASAVHFDVPLTRAAEALLRMPHAEGRGSVYEVGGVLLIDDAYNSSPEAVSEGISLLNATAGGRRRIAVLGDMLELGECTEPLHRTVGAMASRTDLLFAFGASADAIAAGALEAGAVPEAIRLFHNAEECTKELLAELSDGDAVLVKASHALGGGSIVEAIKNRGRGTPR